MKHHGLTGVFSMKKRPTTAGMAPLAANKEKE